MQSKSSLHVVAQFMFVQHVRLYHQKQGCTDKCTYIYVCVCRYTICVCCVYEPTNRCL